MQLRRTINPSRARLDARAQLNAEIEQVLREVRGLVLVKGVLNKRGVSRAELIAHSAEIERTRGRLAELISSRGPQPAALGKAA